MTDQATTATTISAATALRLRAKYESRNPIQRWVLRCFIQRIRQWMDELRPRRVLDFGCGEGYLWSRLSDLGPLPEVVGLDLRTDAVATARARLPGSTWLDQDLFDFDSEGQTFDLVMASQVLEHLYEPGRFLDRLCELTSRWVLVTVPHEPFFQLCNLARGRDVWRLGNHPEHVQRWSKRGFDRFASKFLHIEKIETVFPFILLLGTKRGTSSVGATPHEQTAPWRERVSRRATAPIALHRCD